MATERRKALGFRIRQRRGRDAAAITLVALCLTSALGIAVGSLLWVVASVVMSAWALWLGLGFMRQPVESADPMA